jgi:hypothetical protein
MSNACLHASSHINAARDALKNTIFMDSTLSGERRLPENFAICAARTPMHQENEMSADRKEMRRSSNGCFYFKTVAPGHVEKGRPALNL